jgi:hypothetical protein
MRSYVAPVLRAGPRQVAADVLAAAAASPRTPPPFPKHCKFFNCPVSASLTDETKDYLFDACVAALSEEPSLSVRDSIFSSISALGLRKAAAGGPSLREINETWNAVFIHQRRISPRTSTPPSRLRT